MLYPKISVLLIGSTYDLLQYSQAFKKKEKRRKKEKKAFKKCIC